ncbi:ROK family protein [Sodalis sp. RH20]|uniref:ROK family protein n=1 Tax=unclassified Sodalis (in: enterobacteria) TaxID=2636512 RepID=UPI0039B63AB0
MDYPLTSNTQQLKLINVAHVIETMKALRRGTKATVAQATGLSLATCGTILNSLCASGEILHEALEASSGGRPAQRFIYNEHFFYVFSLAVAGEHGHYVYGYTLTTAIGTLVAGGRETLPSADTASVIAFIHGKTAQYNVRAIGIGLPGVIVDGRVLTCDISAFEDVALRDILAARFAAFIRIGNDMNFTAYGFYKNRRLSKDQPLAYLMFPEKHCPGCGIIVGGKALEGATQFAGEIAHLPCLNRPGAGRALARTVADTVISLISIINPGTIAVTGAGLGPQMTADIFRLCQKTIPRQHVPDIIYRESMDDDYLRGIAEMTLESANYQRLFGASRR